MILKKATYWLQTWPILTGNRSWKKLLLSLPTKADITCHAAIVAKGNWSVPCVVGCLGYLHFWNRTNRYLYHAVKAMKGLVFMKDCWSIIMLPRQDWIAYQLLNQTDAECGISPAMLSGMRICRTRVDWHAKNSSLITTFKVHPLALLKHKKLKDAALTAHIQQLTKGFHDETTLHRKLSFNITYCSIILSPYSYCTFSDFKSNEYANLPGGKYFEPWREPDDRLAWCIPLLWQSL